MANKSKHIVFKLEPDEGIASFIGSYISGTLAERTAGRLAKQDEGEADYISVSCYDPGSILYRAPEDITTKEQLDNELTRGLDATTRDTAIESLERLAAQQGTSFIYSK